GRPRALKMLLPEQRALLHVDGVDVVVRSGRDGDLFGPGRRIRTADNHRRKQRMHHSGLVVELELPEKLHVFDGRGREQFFVALPGRPPDVETIGQPIRAPGCDAEERSGDNHQLSHGIDYTPAMKRFKGATRSSRALPALAIVFAAAAHAQGRGGVDWTTLGSDAQRSFWVRADPKI